MVKIYKPPTNGTDVKDAKKQKAEKRFANIVDAASTLLKETFPFGYKFVQKLKEKSDKQTNNSAEM